MPGKIFKLIFVISFILFPSFNLRADGFKINFNNVDIKVFLNFMSQQLHKNFIIDSSVRGNVTIISPSEIPAAEAERVFWAVLDVYGYTAIEKEGITAIVPVTGLKGKSQEVYLGREPSSLKKLGDKFITQLIPLRFSNAGELVTLFSPFVSKSGKIIADEHSNILIISDNASNVRRLLMMIKELDRKSPPGQETLHIYKLQNASSEEVAKVLTAVASHRAIQQRLRSTRMKKSGAAKAIMPSSIVADKGSNSLIITAAPDEYSALQRIIKELDIVQSQVFIEALIAEVSEGLMSELGIEWESETLRQNLFGLATGSIKSAADLPLTIGSIIHLYRNDTRFHILSTPQIQCINNQEATITVAQNIPFLKESRISEDETVVKTYGYKDVGVVLKIFPQISGENKTVKLKINQELTELIGDLTERPTTAVRSAETTVVVADRRTIVIGGLIKENEKQVIHKVPLLGDIPLLGLLFRRRTFQTEKTNLLIFITPYIVSNVEDAEWVKKKKEKIFKNATGENR